MSKNGYLAKQQAHDAALAQIVSEIYTQHAYDCFYIAMHRVYGFGEARLARLFEEIEAVRREYHDVLSGCARRDPAELGRIDELRGNFDRELQAACGSRFVPFEERQENVRRLRY